MTAPIPISWEAYLPSALISSPLTFLPLSYPLPSPYLLTLPHKPESHPDEQLLHSYKQTPCGVIGYHVRLQLSQS